MNLSNEEYDALSPMMKHYIETKDQNPDCILFYRLGDFYEMFFEDAELVSRELELTLTGKSCGLSERAPMCGVPFHAVDTYLTRLVNKGYKVAICEQVEDPKQAKGMVKREIVRIVTPGTNTDMSAIDEKKNNYLLAIAYFDDFFGICACDVTTGDFCLTQLQEKNKVYDEIIRYSPLELICNETFFMSSVNVKDLRERLNICVSAVDNSYFEKKNCEEILLSHFKVASTAALGIESLEYGILAAGAMMRYLTDTQKISLDHICRINTYLTSSFMLLDAASRRNLELTETLREKRKYGSLLWVLDKTKTAMGGRLLRNYIEQPLTDAALISKRLECVQEFYDNSIDREEIREYLNCVYDLERLLSKISYGSVNPRDMLAFKASVQVLPAVKNLIRDSFKSEMIQEMVSTLDTLEDVCDLIDRAIADEPPLTVKEGGIIKTGYNATVDQLRQAGIKGKEWLAELEEADRERTGIKNLKIKYNKVFGYYFDVTNSYKDMVPDDYIRKQTLTGSERYTNDKLKDLEDKILNSSDRLMTLEYDLFVQVRDYIYAQIERIQGTARAIAGIDVFSDLAYVAEKNRYVRPKVNDGGAIKIKGGRHPVVEQMIDKGSFIENDTYLDNSKKNIAIITGPNMAGKSTYMRQSALIVLMAQMGSFVPAKEATIACCDRIFTRVGASDDLASGQSTFMVEMTEVANILRNATPKSLLILDEIGRGTATFDGLAIAWAVIEYIADRQRLGSKTLFATHYHELTELEGKLPGVNNYCIAVKENGDDIIFLRKIISGGADKSYGIQVAKLAGVPDGVIRRADELVEQLMSNDITSKIKDMAQLSEARKKIDEMELSQMSLFATQTDDDIINELRNMDIEHMMPVDALVQLQKLKSKVINRI